MDLTTISTALSSLQTAKDLLKTINDSKDLFEKVRNWGTKISRFK